VDVSATAAEAGIRFPVFLSRRVFHNYVTVPPEAQGQDETGRLWDIVWSLRLAIKCFDGDDDRIKFAHYSKNDSRHALMVQLVATCGPLDMDDPQPAITIMMPGED
jgi:hypothetical protein